MEQRVYQGIVDDAAAICGAVLAELRLRPGLFGPQGGRSEDDLVQAALGGALAARPRLRDQTARRLREAPLRSLLPPERRPDRSVRLARCPAGAAEALDLGGLLQTELWCAEIPLLIDGETAGSLRLFVESEPGKPLLRALRGIGHEASLQLEQEQARLAALAEAEHQRQVLRQLSSSAARLRRETERKQVLRAVGEELRKLGFESALVLRTGEGNTLSLAHLSHRPAKVAQGFRLLGFSSFFELSALQVDPQRSPLLQSLLATPEPVVEVRAHALLRALFGRRASRPVREQLIELFGLRELLAAPLRGAADVTLGILIAAAPLVEESDLGALAAFALQASWSLERCLVGERLRAEQGRAEAELREQTRALTEEVERLQQTGKRKDNFLANVSHELRSPLVTVLGYTDLLLGEKLGPITDKQRQCLQIARNSGRRLRSFIEELLDFSRFELTKPLLAREPIDLRETISLAVANFAPRLLERRINVRQRVPRGTPQALGDRERVLQVLANLIQNADRHCRDGGRIQIFAAADERGMVKISVQDNGSGIAPEHQARIFERLYQVTDAPPARAREGLGLGLHIVKSIVEEHGGTVTVHSVIGRGSTFSFTLPASPRSTPARAGD